MTSPFIANYPETGIYGSLRPALDPCQAALERLHIVPKPCQHGRFPAFQRPRSDIAALEGIGEVILFKSDAQIARFETDISVGEYNLSRFPASRKGRFWRGVLRKPTDWSVV